MLWFAIMVVMGFARIRTLLLLVAFGLSFGGQAITGVVMAAPAIPAAATPASMVSECHGCGSTAALAPQCGTVFCANVPLVPTQRAAFETSAAMTSISALYVIGPGLSSRPDPYPPRPALARDGRVRPTAVTLPEDERRIRSTHLKAPLGWASGRLAA